MLPEPFLSTVTLPATVSISMLPEPPPSTVTGATSRTMCCYVAQPDLPVTPATSSTPPSDVRVPVTSVPKLAERRYGSCRVG